MTRVIYICLLYHNIANDVSWQPANCPNVSFRTVESTAKAALVEQGMLLQSCTAILWLSVLAPANNFGSEHSSAILSEPNLIWHSQFPTAL
jgi:hypothetical protein